MELIKEKHSVSSPSTLLMRRGQMAITIVIVVLLFLLLVFPVINMFVQNEGKWSVKEKKSTAAFHLAEAGIDRARWKLMENTDMWTITSTGTLPGYKFDKVYTDVGGGSYAITISSDPVDADKRIVESVGRDASGTEVRRIKAVLVNSNSADFATRAVNMVSNTGGNDHIELGPVISGNTIDATARTFPRYFSAGHVTPQDGGSTAASTDNVYWWSYYAIPPMPNVKFAVYMSSAQWFNDHGINAPDGCGSASGATYYRVGNAEFKNCQDTSGRTYYITGDVTFKSGGASGNFIRGTVIMLGNFIVSGTGGASGAYNARLPPEAWKEYGANWSHYKTTFDAGAPVDYATAVSTNYLATGKTYPLSNVLIHGFMYTGGSQGLTGGGNCNLNGVLLSNVNATMGTSTMGIYYDDDVAADIQLQGVTITLSSWYEVKGEWPGGL